jgi:hypothetical protein
MCLIIKSRELPPELIKDGRITVYKMLRCTKGAPYTVFQLKSVTAGWFKAEGPEYCDFCIYYVGDNGPLDGEELGNGFIHCLLDAKPAPQWGDSTFIDDVMIVECWGLPEDFVAVGIHGDIAFKKIYISQEAIDSAKAEYKGEIFEEPKNG